MKVKAYLLGIFLLLQSLVYGKGIEVAAGPFAYFGIELPNKMVAGETYSVTLTAYDIYGNKTNYFGESGRSFTLKTAGNIAVSPTQLDSGMFGSGSVVLKLSDRVSEAAAFAIDEGGRPMLVKEARSGGFVNRFNLNVEHAPLASFALALSKERIAGEPFDVTVTAKDAEGNTIADYGNFGQGVTLEVEGASGKRGFSVQAHNFSNGVATASLRYDIPEAVRVTVTEFGGSARGSVGPFTLTEQTLTRIKIKMPTSIRAGALFSLDVTVYNQFGREMKNYAAVGRDLMLSTNGTGRLIPDRIPASAFVEGRTKFETLYTKPEAIEISAAPVGGKKPQMERAAAAVPPAPRAAAGGVVPMADTGVQSNALEGQPVPRTAQKVSHDAPVASVEPKASGTGSAKKGLPLSLRFSSNLGDIDRIDSEYRPRGKHGSTYITLSFSKGRGVREVQPIQKEIRAKGRVIGTLFVDGTLDDRGRMTVRIDEKEPFTVEAKSSGSTLHLHFYLPAS